MTTPPEELTLDLPGLRLGALAWGPPGGRPVLALHGWLDNAASFTRLAPLLGPARVVALDLPGHGRSDHRPESAAYHFIDWVPDVFAAADALGWERFALVGHSMGAAVASLAAGALPDRVERLGLIEGLGPNAVTAAEAPERLERAIRERARRGGRPPRVHPDLAQAVARLREANRDLDDEAARLLVARGTRPVEGGLTWSADPRLRGLSPLRMTEEHVLAFLARIAAPALVVRAGGGYPFDAALLRERFARLRDGRLLEVEGGHHVHLTHPERLAEPLRAHLLAPVAPPAPAEPLTARAARVRLVVLDVDGVLTDGGLLYGPAGSEAKRFSIHDGLGLKLLQRAGVEVALLSGRASEGVERRAGELGIQHALLGVDDKLPALERLLVELGVAADEAAYMGDDLPDLAPIRHVGLGAAPADARPEVRAAARLVTRSPGGHGAVRELAEAILRARGAWEGALARFGPAGR